MPDQPESGKNDDRNAIPYLIGEIDRLLADDTNDTEDPEDTPEAAGMSAEDVAYADAKLLRLLGLSPASAATAETGDDLEWEHFVLIATASFAPVETTRDDSPDSTRRDIRLDDRAIVSALFDKAAGSGRRLPILRLERKEMVTASIVGATEVDPDVRVRVTIGSVSIELRVEDGSLVGSSSEAIDAALFTDLPVAVSVLRK